MAAIPSDYVFTKLAIYWTHTDVGGWLDLSHSASVAAGVAYSNHFHVAGS